MYKKDFPIFTNNKELVYLDSASTSQKPLSVISGVNEFLTNSNASPNRGSYTLAYQAGELLDQSRATVAKFLGASSDQVAFTTSTTDSINKIVLGLEYNNLFIPGDEIVLTRAEHHSNITPWQELAKRHNLKIRYINIDKSGNFDTSNLEDLVTNKTKVISFTLVSNVTGVKSNYQPLMEQAKKHNIITIIDACQATPHIPINVQTLESDFLVFSGHKMFSYTGVGVIYCKNWDLLQPMYFGGGIVKTVEDDYTEFIDFPEVIEAGTYNIAAIYSLKLAIDYINSIGFDQLQKYEAELLNKLLELQRLDKVQIVAADNDNRISLVSFTIDNVHPHDVSQILNNSNIAIRSGHHCAKLLHKSFGIQSSSRASISIYNTLDDVEQFLDKVKFAVRYFE
jgi:cysteine desulfurase/selenocysteine lyase